jgi:hypothetical protein
MEVMEVMEVMYAVQGTVEPLGIPLIGWIASVTLPT